jgi:hypothetical protein
VVPREFRSERPPGASEDTEQRGHHGPPPRAFAGYREDDPTVKLISKSCNPASHGA